MEDREKPSWPIRILGPLIFILISMAAFTWFFWRLFALVSGITSQIVLFDKGSFYMLGVGVTILALSYAGVQESWLGKTLTEKSSYYISKVAIIGVVIVFTIPHFIHYVSSHYLESNGYSVCEDASRQWLFNRNIVYIQDSIKCSEGLIQEITSN